MHQISVRSRMRQVKSAVARVVSRGDAMLRALAWEWGAGVDAAFSLAYPGTSRGLPASSLHRASHARPAALRAAGERLSFPLPIEASDE